MLITKISLLNKRLLSLALFITIFITSCDDVIPVLELVEVNGTVQEVSSSQPIAGVSVSILDQEGINPQLTGANGTFRFSDLRLDDGTYKLLVSSDDYIDEETVFTIENGKQTDTLRIGLIASEVLTFNQSVLDFGSGTDEINLEVTNASTSTQTFSLSTEVPWLTFSDDNVSFGAEASETITFTVDRAKAEVGSYEEMVTFEVEGRPTQSIVVKMQKLDPTAGMLVLNKNSIDFGKAAESQTIKLSNSGQSTLNWTATSAVSWLTISAPGGATEPDQDSVLTVVVDRTGLENGMYESSISFGGDGGTATLTVLMEVDNSIGLLNLSTSSLDFGLENESSQVTLTNEGTNSLDWTATVNDEWISLDVTSGTLDVGDNFTTTVTVDRSTLPAGIYEGSIDFTSNEETSTLSIALEVQGGILSISETTLNMGSAENSQIIEFSNVGMRPLTWASQENTDWLNIIPNDGSIEVDATSSILIVVDRTGLGLGDYSADIQITSEEENFTITVNMTVAQDTDGDGVPDEVDADFDGDGLIEIYTINDLHAIRNDLDASGEGKQGAPSGGFTGYELMNDLDFSNEADYSDSNLYVKVTESTGWEPLGLDVADYDGIFEGNGFIISNLFINRTTNYTALIASTSQFTVVKNLSVEIRILTGAGYTAGLVGYNNGSIINCSVLGELQGEFASGLLAGVHAQGIIENCYSDGFVTCSGNSSGGLIGIIGDPNYYTSPDIEVRNSYSTATVSGNQWVGGLIGTMASRYSGIAIISSCYSTGEVSASPSSRYSPGAGGLIASFGENGTIENCYSSSNVTAQGTTSQFYVGGLVGEIYSSGTIVISCYYTGDVISNATSGYFGGFVGTNTGSIASSNYWDTETNGLDTSPAGTGLTTSQLQTPTSADGIYITWGSNAWDYGTSTEYPALKNMPNGLDAQRD